MFHAVVAAFVTRHPASLVPDLNFKRHQLGHRTLAALERRRVPVRARTDATLLIHQTDSSFFELETLRRQWQQVLAFVLHPNTNRMCFAGDVTFLLLAATRQQVVVQLFPIRELRDRRPVIAAEVADLAFHTAFLVSTARIAKFRLKTPMRAKHDEPFCLLTLVTPKDLPHRQR